MIESELVVHYPLGSSTRRKKRVILLAGIVGFLGAGLLVFAGAYSKYLSECTSESRAEDTSYQVKEYANRAFLRWVMNHPDQTCPDGLADLNQYTNRMGADINDAWGRPMLMDCRNGPLRVWSLGEDGKANTPDDIVSE